MPTLFKRPLPHQVSARGLFLGLSLVIGLTPLVINQSHLRLNKVM